MPIYSIDVKLYGTIYITAENKAKALEIARQTKDCDFELRALRDVFDDIKGINELSPAMTCHGPEGDFPLFVANTAEEAGVREP